MTLIVEDDTRSMDCRTSNVRHKLLRCDEIRSENLGSTPPCEGNAPRELVLASHGERTGRHKGSVTHWSVILRVNTLHDGWNQCSMGTKDGKEQERLAARTAATVDGESWRSIINSRKGTGFRNYGALDLGFVVAEDSDYHRGRHHGFPYFVGKPEKPT